MWLNSIAFEIHLLKTFFILFKYIFKFNLKGEDTIIADQQDQHQYKYMTVDDIKGLDDTLKLDTTEDRHEKGLYNLIYFLFNLNINNK